VGLAKRKIEERKEQKSNRAKVNRNLTKSIFEKVAIFLFQIKAPHHFVFIVNEKMKLRFLRSIRVNGTRFHSMRLCPYSTECKNLTLQQNYTRLTEKAELKEDPQQLKLLKTLEKVQKLVEAFDFSVFDKSISVSNDNSSNDSTTSQLLPSRLRGVYIYGPVGSGKSMIMDMFFDSCLISRKKRVHFHQFMLDVHKRIFQHKQTLLATYGRDRHINLSSARDSIRFVASQISQETKLLCFDEFQVTDIADAVILSKLFGELWSHGTVLIATSNRPPKDLYSEGLNRRDFLPFIEQLEKECLVRELNNSIDYRLSESQELEHTYFLGNHEENYQRLFHLYEMEIIYLKSIPSQDSLLVKDEIKRNPQTGEFLFPVSFSSSRFLSIKQVDLSVRCCFVDFQSLCDQDKGAADYKTLTKYFHSVYLTGIPKLSKLHHNSARRFIILIDELYNQNVRFLFTSEVEPLLLFEEEKEHWERVPQPELKDRLKVDDEEISKYGRNYDTSKCNYSLVIRFYFNFLFFSEVAQERLSAGQQEEINVYQGELASIKELSFAFQRAASRLVEMTSVQYYNRWKSKYFPTVNE
jgi:predicted ATPase